MRRTPPRPRRFGPKAGPAATPGPAGFASPAAWLAIAALAGALLFIARGPHRMGAFDVETDFYGGYAPAAMQIQRGGYLADDGKIPAMFGFVGPLYPLLLALSGFALGDLFSAAELLSVAGCVTTVVLWFLLLRRRVDARLGLVAVLLLATNPVLVRYGYSVTTDATALALQSAALFLLLVRAGDAGAAGAGLFVALAALTRYTSAYLVPAGVIAIAAGLTHHPRRKRAAALFVAGFIALALPWQIYAALHGGEMQFHQLLAFDVYGYGRGIPWDDFLATIWPRFQHAPLAVITSDPGAVAARLLFNVVDHLRRDASALLGRLVAILAGLGVVAGLVERRNRAWVAPITLFGVWAFLALVPAPSSERYSLAVLPFYIVFAGSAVMWARDRATGAPQQMAIWVLTGFVVTASLLITVRTQAHVMSQQPLETIACAERLRQLARPGDRVIARKPHLAFHSGIASEYFPASESLAVLARHAHATRTRWLQVSVAEVMLRPRLAFLLDTSAAVPGLTLRGYDSVPVVIDGLPWRRVAALYEIGPEFGEAPAWFASDTLRTLHTLRGANTVIPDANQMMALARVELAAGHLPGARAAWREVARMDPTGTSRLLAKYGGDTLEAVAHVKAVLE